MRIESQLCHISDNKAVVKVNGWINETNLGSALAEGPTVEIAEDKAISRLNNRINVFKNNLENIKSNNENQNEKPIKLESTKSEESVNTNVIQEPSDWSNELTAIDSEIQRLKWSREDEIHFLKEQMGYNNRNRITKYSELLNYLNLLKKTDNVSKPKNIKTSINTLIEESDSILIDLSWDHKQGREYLKKEFNVSTRTELDEKQLISFVQKLKTIRNKYQS